MVDGFEGSVSTELFLNLSQRLGLPSWFGEGSDAVRDLGSLC